MRNRFFLILLFGVSTASDIFADTTAVATDSAMKPFTPPDHGPLGIDTTTGIALYTIAILFAVFVIALWRSAIMKMRKTNG